MVRLSTSSSLAAQASGFCGVQDGNAFVNQITAAVFLNQDGVTDGPIFASNGGDNLKFHTPKIPHPPRDNVDDVKFLFTCVVPALFASQSR